MSKPRGQIYIDNAGEWRWRIVDSNGENRANPGEGFKTEEEAKTDLLYIVGMELDD